MQEKIKPSEYYKVTDTEVFGFFEEHSFLSNFHYCFVPYEQRVFKCTEAAYMSAKTLDPVVKTKFTAYLGVEAKKEGRIVTLRPDWNETKVNVMSEVLLSKFVNNSELRSKLLATGDKVLIEANHWNDKFWGCDYKTREGENMLGRLLMHTRWVLSCHAIWSPT